MNQFWDKVVFILNLLCALMTICVGALIMAKAEAVLKNRNACPGRRAAAAAELIFRGM